MKELTRVEMPRRAETSAITLAGSNSHPVKMRFNSPRLIEGAASHSERSTQPSPMLAQLRTTSPSLLLSTGVIRIECNFPALPRPRNFFR